MKRSQDQHFQSAVLVRTEGVTRKTNPCMVLIMLTILDERPLMSLITRATDECLPPLLDTYSIFLFQTCMFSFF